MSEGPASSGELPLVAGDIAAAVVEPVAAVSPSAEAAPAAIEPAAAGAEVGAAPEGATEPPAVEEKPADGAEPGVDGEEKPAEADAAKDGEGAKPGAEIKPEAKTYEAFKLPEGMNIEAAEASAFGNILGKYGLTQEAGQEIMDFGSSILKQAQERMAQGQIDAFAETRRGWVKEFETQAGNRRNTMLNDAKQAIKDAVPDDKARAKLWSVLAYTGAGDHPDVIKAFAAIGKRARERGAPGPAVPAKQQSTSPAERRYGPRN